MNVRSAAVIHALDPKWKIMQNASAKSAANGRATAHVLIRALSSTYGMGSTNHFHVRVRPSIFRLWWCMIMLLHALCLVFFGCSAWLYWRLPSISLGFTFAIYRITLPDNNLLAPALCSAAVALAHAFSFLRLASYCVWHRRLTFDVQWLGTRSGRDRTFTLFSEAQGARLDRWSASCTHFIVRIFGRQGWLGVESEHFELVYIMREVVETALQSVQAYKLSLMISQAYLCNIFAIMIFINCWSTPIVLHHFADHPPLARLICLLLDIGLDFVSTVLVPLILVVPYFQYYDPFTQDFASIIWYDDVLLVNALNEFRLVMITTWSELAARIMFSVGMLTCLENSKYLLRPDHSRKKTQPIPVSPAVETPKQASREKQSSFSIRLAILMHVLFMAWGLAVLLTHIQAATHTKLAGCAVQVRPWFASKSACALMYVNCRTQQTDGSLRDLDSLMMHMNEQSLVHIAIRHCPNVEIPPQIQAFTHLAGMKIYNSTIARWEREAALTAHHHSNMVLLYLVDVNMTQVPDGLLSEDFPQQLRDIEISGTNLTQLPDVLDQRWQTNGLLVLELCSFPVFPKILSRMKMSIFVLGSNQFTDIPEELLTNPFFFVLLMSRTPIMSLPSTLPGAVSTTYLVLDYTELVTFPSWIDEAFLQNTQVSAVGTVACEQIITAAAVEIANSSASPSLVHAYKSGSLKCDHVSYMISPYYPRYLEKRLDEQV